MIQLLALLKLYKHLIHSLCYSLTALYYMGHVFLYYIHFGSMFPLIILVRSVPNNPFTKTLTKDSFLVFSQKNQVT